MTEFPTMFEYEAPPTLIIVHNPLARSVMGRLSCARDDWALDLTIAPHAKWEGVGTVMEYDMHDDACKFDLFP